MKKLVTCLMFSAILAVAAAQFKTGDYYYNEAKTGNRCGGENQDWLCDGARTCSPHGWCQGYANHPASMTEKGPSYYFDEKVTGNKCYSDYMCDGERTCSPNKWCQGDANHPKVKGPSYKFDEAPRGNRCANDWECDGARTCSAYGYCQGVSRS